MAVVAIVLSWAPAFAQTPAQHSGETKAAADEAAPPRFEIRLRKMSRAYDAKDFLISIVKKLNRKLGGDWLTSYRHAPELSAAQIDKFTKALEEYLTPDERDFLAVNLTGYRRAYDCPFVVKLDDRVACRENTEAREAILKRYQALGYEAKQSGRALFDLILKEPRSAQLWHSQGKDVFARRLADAIRGMALTVETRRDRPGFTQRELGFERALTAYREWTSGVQTEVVDHFLPKSDIEPKTEPKLAPAVVHPKSNPAVKKVETPKIAPVANAKPIELAAVGQKLETKPAPTAKPTPAQPTASVKKTKVKVAPTVAKKTPAVPLPVRKNVVAKKAATPVKKLAAVSPKDEGVSAELPQNPHVLSPPINIVDNDVEKANVHTTEVASPVKDGLFKTMTKPVTNLMGGVKETFFPKHPADPKGVVAPELWTSGEMTGLPIIHDLREGKEYARYILMKLRKMARDDLANRDAIYRAAVASYEERKKAFYASKHPSGQRPPPAPVKPTGKVSWYEAVRDGATSDERKAFLAGLDRLTPAEKSFLVPMLASIGEVGHITSGRCKGKGCVEDRTGIANGNSVLRTIYNSAKSPLWGSGTDYIDEQHHDKSLPDRMFYASLKNGRFSPWNYSGRFPSGARTQGNIPGMLKSLEKALNVADDEISTDPDAQKAERMINAYVEFSTDNVDYKGFDVQKNGIVYPIVFFSAPGYHLSGTAVPSGPYLTYKNDPKKIKYYTAAHRFGYDKNTGYRISMKGEETE